MYVPDSSDFLTSIPAVKRWLLAALVAVAVLAAPASASREAAPFIKGPSSVTPGKSVTFTVSNVEAKDINWVRVQPKKCPSSHGCRAAFAQLKAKAVSGGVQITFTWPAGYDTCKSAPQGSGSYCPAAAHTWKDGEAAQFFVGTFVFLKQACLSVKVKQASGTPKQAAPKDGMAQPDWYPAPASCS
jgi:hypothetical protein